VQETSVFPSDGCYAVHLRSADSPFFYVFHRSHFHDSTQKIKRY
jgi:hypothetical protein